jgi:DNA-binding LytR/AlgR family response regulator
MIAKCLIVDDEPIAADVIRNHVRKLSQLEVVATANDAIEAFEVLQSGDIDLMFLDIQMPGITGLDLLRSLARPPKVIIVSAYREYALEGFELDVVDYLLKPVSFGRFLKSINKYFNSIGHNVEEREFSGSDKIDPPMASSTGSALSEPKSIWIRADRKNVKIPVDKILYIEGLKDYVKIFTDTEMIISKVSMKDMQDKFTDDRFLRIHRSFLVSIRKIKAFNNDEIEIANKSLPIGRSYKQEVISCLSNERE